ncbi:MAG: VOC family protein [Alphaproteobacteria bacterium]|nr:VOC family protein [Alphaproteobacteria bacterium]
MAKLRHIAMQVPDLEKAAAFYEKVFGLERVVRGDTPFGNALMLSDGVINLALLQFPPGTKGMMNGPDWAGLHHFGFIVEDAGETKKLIEKEGGSYFTTLPGGFEGLQAEEKYKDPNGIVFDISEHGWRTKKLP